MSVGCTVSGGRGMSGVSGVSGGPGGRGMSGGRGVSGGGMSLRKPPSATHRLPGTGCAGECE